MTGAEGRGAAAEEERLVQAPLFVALTRPQMLAGVTYPFFVINAVITTEAFLLIRSPWVLALALALHGGSMVMGREEPRWIDLWLLRAMRCPRAGNYRFWRCNSYRP